jgi:SH3-like domain-containing protein
MRLLFAILGCSLLVCLQAAAQQTFPYTTIVASDDVYVRSGPGQNYYPTEKLRRGQSVEVYRHDPGGWCAIRPVEGSYSWVSGRFIKPIDDHVGVIVEDGVSSRVGSHFSDNRDVIQVRLQNGEEVAILESPQQNSRGRDSWYKIAPPSGEFRWVSAKFLDANYPLEGVRKTSDATHHPDRRDASTDDDSMAVRSGRSRSLTPEQYNAELTRIELQLSAMVIEDPRTWSFDSLSERTNQLLDQAQTAVERGRARLLANKIARFEDIKQRQDAVLAMRDDVNRESRMLSHLRPRDDQNDIDDRFDGVGHLTQVVSPKQGAPRYALTDDRGDVRCYVTPAPGLDVQNYIGQRVGVTGSRGYVPEEHAGHIMARHITSLDGPMLR